MLNTETNTPAMDARILKAAHKALMRRNLTTFSSMANGGLRILKAARSGLCAMRPARAVRMDSTLKK